MDQRYYKTTEAAKYLGLSEYALRKYAKDGLIVFSRPGGKDMLFDKEEMDKFIRNSRGK